MFRSVAYADVFLQHLRFNPHTASKEQLLAAVEPLEVNTLGLYRDDLLDLLFSHFIQPELKGLYFVYDYPASLSALARIEMDPCGYEMARRFECFFNGVELGNGYHELLDAEEYMRRHTADNQRRQSLNKPSMSLDEKFYAAMQAGLPDCAGVAVGLDRVFMLASEQVSLDAVLDFPITPE